MSGTLEDEWMMQLKDPLLDQVSRLGKKSGKLRKRTLLNTRVDIEVTEAGRLKAD